MLVRKMWHPIVVLCIMVVCSMRRGAKQLWSLRIAQEQYGSIAVQQLLSTI